MYIELCYCLKYIKGTVNRLPLIFVNSNVPSVSGFTLIKLSVTLGQKHLFPKDKTICLGTANKALICVGIGCQEINHYC